MSAAKTPCARCIAQSLVATARGSLMTNTANSLVDRIEAELRLAFRRGATVARKKAKAQAVPS